MNLPPYRKQSLNPTQQKRNPEPPGDELFSPRPENLIFFRLPLRFTVSGVVRTFYLGKVVCLPTPRTHSMLGGAKIEVHLREKLRGVKTKQAKQKKNIRVKMDNKRKKCY